MLYSWVFIRLPFYGDVRAAAFPLRVLCRLGRATPGAAHDHAGDVRDQAGGAGQPVDAQELGAATVAAAAAAGHEAGATGEEGGPAGGREGGKGTADQDGVEGRGSAAEGGRWKLN